MKKILFIFLGIAFLAGNGVYAARTKGIVNPKVKTKTIEVEKIVKVPGKSVVIKNEVNMNVGACGEEYRYKTVSYCSGHNGCKEMSSIEVLMEIDPVISAGCRELAYNSKLTAIEDGIAVHLRCLNANGLYDMNKGICRFTVELRRGKKVKETAEVWEDIEYTCGKELFPMAAKNRRKAIIGGGVIGAGAGAVGGGLLFKNVIGYNKNLHKILETECAITDKKARKAVIKKLKNNSYTDWDAFVQGLITDGKLSPDAAKKCASYFYRESYIENVYQVIEKIFPAVDSKLYSVLDEEVYFQTGSANFSVPREKPTEVLNSFYDALVDSNVQDCVKLTMVGYASNVGSSGSNLNLAQRRAETVKNYFVGKGILAGNISVTSKGDEGNAGGSNNSHNRRVDIGLDLESCTSQIGMPAPGANPANPNTPVTGGSEYRMFEGKTLVLDHNKFQTKKNFAKGAMIGAPVGGLLGAGLGALFTKYKCYLSGTDELLAKWKKTFKISPPSTLPTDTITTDTLATTSSSSYSATTSIETSIDQ